MPNETKTLTLILCGQPWVGKIVKQEYSHGRTTALEFIDAADGDNITTLTVNVPQLIGRPSYMVAIKDYSENEGVLAQLVEEGIVEATGELVSSGHVQIPLARITRKELL